MGVLAGPAQRGGLGGAEEKTPCVRHWGPQICVARVQSRQYVLLAHFTDVSARKQSACNAGVVGSIAESGSSPGGGHRNPLQYSCLENSMDRGAWRATVHRVAKSWT